MSGRSVSLWHEVIYTLITVYYYNGEKSILSVQSDDGNLLEYDSVLRRHKP